MPMMNVNGAELFYIVKGEGTPILFVHPPVLNSVSFSGQIQVLSRYFTTIAFDIRGHGRSPFTKEKVTYPLIVSDMKELLDKLKVDKVFLCGYSTGGSIVLEFLLTYPDRAIGGIVISGMSEVHDFRLRTRIILGRTLCRGVTLQGLAMGLAWSNAERGMIWETFKESRKSNSRNAAEYYDASLHYNCTRRLNEIHRPVLLLYGAKDTGFHSYGELLHTHLPNNQLRVIPNVSHQIPMMKRKALNREMMHFIHKHETSEF